MAQRGWDILVVDTVYFYVVRKDNCPEGGTLRGLDLTYAEAEAEMHRLRDLTR